MQGEGTFGPFIGVKRNAERYMFQEPRPPVDAVRARIRDPLFSFRYLQSDVNFLVTFAKSALSGPKMHFGPIFRILSPKIDFGAQNALFRPKSLLDQKGLHFHQNSIGFISIRGMGTQKCIFRKKCTLAPKMHFCTQNAFWSQKVILESKVHFLRFWPEMAPFELCFKGVWCKVQKYDSGAKK